MGPKREFHFAPGEVDVRVVLLRLGQRADFVREGEGLAEVLELVFLLQVMLGHHLSAAAQFAGQFRQAVSFQRRHPAFARDTLFFS